jgi:selenocysteine lyase/cysteine desulfurase
MNPAVVAENRELLTDQESAAIRKRFPVFNRRIYLNSCSQGALSDAVRIALEQHLSGWDDMGSPWEEWVTVYDRARAAFADFIHSDPDEIAVVPSASAAINSVASSLDYRERRRVIMGEYEFPTMGQIWLAQQRRGAEVHFLDAQDGSLLPSAYEHAIDEKSLITPLTHVCFMNGHRSDVRTITEIAHRQGTLVMLDDYQDCGTRPVDVRGLGVDFYVSGALKYLLAPSGIAFLYVRRELIRLLVPTVTGWFGQKDPFAFQVKQFDPAPNARRFEAGSPPVPQSYAVLASLELLNSIGPARIAAHIGALAQAYLAGARRLKIRSKTPLDSRGPLVVLQMRNAEVMVKALLDEGIVASSRKDGLRVSFHLYNTMEDVAAVLRLLEKNIHLAVQDDGAQ